MFHHRPFKVHSAPSILGPQLLSTRRTRTGGQFTLSIHPTSITTWHQTTLLPGTFVLLHLSSNTQNTKFPQIQAFPECRDRDRRFQSTCEERIDPESFKEASSSPFFGFPHPAVLFQSLATHTPIIIFDHSHRTTTPSIPKCVQLERFFGFVLRALVHNPGKS